MLYGSLGARRLPRAASARPLAQPDEAPAARLALARKLLAQLPATNWFKRNPFVSDHVAEGDAGLHDLLLHARDRAYEVGDIAAMVAGADSRLVDFVPPARYEPASYLSDAAMLKRIDGLPMIARAAFAESLAGNIKSHAFYVVRAGNAVEPPRPDDPTAVPVWSDADPAPLRKTLKPGGVLNISAEGAACASRCRASPSPSRRPSTASAA